MRRRGSVGQKFGGRALKPPLEGGERGLLESDARAKNVERMILMGKMG